MLSETLLEIHEYPVISIYNNQLGHTEPQLLTVDLRTLMKAFTNSPNVFFIDDRSLSRQLEWPIQFA